MAKTMSIAAFVFLFCFQLSFSALPVPSAAEFSDALLTSFADDSFTFQAFDIVHNSITDGYIITASISSVSGAPPSGIKDASRIATMKQTALVNITTGLVMHLSSKTEKITWGHRIFLLPKGSTLRAIVGSNGKTYIAGVTEKTPSGNRRAFAAFSADGKNEYVKTYGSSDSRYMAVSLLSGKEVAFAIWSKPGHGRQGNVVGVDKIALGSGAMAKSSQLIFNQDNRVTTAEQAFDIATIEPNHTISLTRVQTSDSRDRNYLSHDRVCSHMDENAKVNRCVLIPVAGPNSAITQMALAPTRIYLAQLIGVGVAEVMNLTTYSIDTLQYKGKISTFELPTAEGEGVRTRSSLASMQYLPNRQSGSEHRLRVLFTTAGPIDMEGAELDPHGRVAILDFQEDGKIGGKLLDTKYAQSVRPAALVPLLPKETSSTVENSIVIGTILATKRGSTGSLYLKTMGDPIEPKKSVADDAPVVSKANPACIGIETLLNNVPVREIIRGKLGIREQLHPLKWLLRQSTEEIPMLCFEEAASTRICATDYHILHKSGRAIYMKDICAERGDCTRKLQSPINFKGKCGTLLRVSDKLHLTMHSATERWAEAGEVVYKECMMRVRAYPLWLLRTL